MTINKLKMTSIGRKHEHNKITYRNYKIEDKMRFAKNVISYDLLEYYNTNFE